MQIIRNTSKLLQTKGWLNCLQLEMKAKMKAIPNVIHAVLYHKAWLPCIILALVVSTNETHVVILYYEVCVLQKSIKID